jgi:hypothetical protein
MDLPKEIVSLTPEGKLTIDLPYFFRLDKGGELYEKLAAIEHKRWADWQKYLHSKCDKVTGRPINQGLLIPADLVKHWERQIRTEYKDLSEAEKQSDRDQVDRYWPLLEKHFNESS